MRRLFMLVTALGTSLLLSSCMVFSTQPLCPLEEAKADPALVGDWPTKNKPGEIQRITVLNPHEMRMTVISKETEGKPDYYDFYPTVINGEKLLSLKWETGPRGEVLYLFARYEIDKDHNQVLHLMDMDKMQAAVQTGALKGKIEKGTISGPFKVPDITVTLTDSSAKISAFIRKAGVDAIFDDQL